ncbi:MAG: redox-regulated ATPase YchF [Acidobacteria bacterium]|nr:redox-regulated ATPase YchF [Acidobacteriota bacterium]
MKTIIFGLPQTGKSTLFRLLTGHPKTEIRYDSSGSPMPQVGVTHVPDERIDFIHKFFPESKAVYPQIEYTDLVGLKLGDVKESRLLAYLRQADLIIHVIRAFKNDAVFHSSGDIDPSKDFQRMEDEMILADLIILENRLEKLEKTVMKTKNPDDEMQLHVLRKVKPVFEESKPLRGFTLSPEEEKAIRGFGFITQKPLQLVVNIDETSIANRKEIAAKLSDSIQNKENIKVSYICAPVEQEIAEMGAEDAKEFMADYSLTHLGRDRIIQDSYELLGLISFLTIGKDECRSWPVRENTKAVNAAGAVHSDIEKGFIAAEVIKYTDYVETPNEQQLKTKGLVKIQGKEYIVQDGDIINFRFNV